MKKVLAVLSVMAMAITVSACTEYKVQRDIYLYVEDGGEITVGDIEVLAEIASGDVAQEAKHALDGKLDIPIGVVQ